MNERDCWNGTALHVACGMITMCTDFMHDVFLCTMHSYGISRQSIAEVALEPSIAECHRRCISQQKGNGSLLCSEFVSRLTRNARVTPRPLPRCQIFFGQARVKGKTNGAPLSTRIAAPAAGLGWLAQTFLRQLFVYLSA
jgi:hypothetical protein